MGKFNTVMDHVLGWSCPICTWWCGSPCTV